MSIEIRREEEKDYRQVEELTRKAFYNVYMPGWWTITAGKRPSLPLAR